MDLGVGRVTELLEHDRARRRCRNLFGLAHGFAHQRARREHDLGT